MILCSVQHRLTVFTKICTRDLIVNLLTLYHRITPMYLTANSSVMKSVYNPNLPVETLFDQIYDDMAYANSGNQPYSSHQITNIPYNTIFIRRIYPEYFRE